jgi:hypothetical protein
MGEKKIRLSSPDDTQLGLFGQPRNLTPESSFIRALPLA